MTLCLGLKGSMSFWLRKDRNPEIITCLICMAPTGWDLDRSTCSYCRHKRVSPPTTVWTERWIEIDNDNCMFNLSNGSDTSLKLTELIELGSKGTPIEFWIEIQIFFWIFLRSFFVTLFARTPTGMYIRICIDNETIPYSTPCNLPKQHSTPRKHRAFIVQTTADRAYWTRCRYQSTCDVKQMNQSDDSIPRSRG